MLRKNKLVVSCFYEVVILFGSWVLFCFVLERERERRLSEIEGFEFTLLCCQTESSSMLNGWWTLLQDDGRTKQEPCLTWTLVLL